MSHRHSVLFVHNAMWNTESETAREWEAVVGGCGRVSGKAASIFSAGFLLLLFIAPPAALFTPLLSLSLGRCAFLFGICSIFVNIFGSCLWVIVCISFCFVGYPCACGLERWCGCQVREQQQLLCMDLCPSLSFCLSVIPCLPFVASVRSAASFLLVSSSFPPPTTVTSSPHLSSPQVLFL